MENLRATPDGIVTDGARRIINAHTAEDAQRIAICWNLCADVPTNILEETMDTGGTMRKLIGCLIRERQRSTLHAEISVALLALVENLASESNQSAEKMQALNEAKKAIQKMRASS